MPDPTFKIDGTTILSKSGTNVLWGSGAPPGMVLEQFLLPCTGQSITVQSGTYTSQTVTTTQDSSGTWADITGSTISYTPPSGAQLVIYKFITQVGYSTTNVRLSFKFLLNSAEASSFGSHIQTDGNYPNFREVFEYPLLIGGSDDATIGRQATWTTSLQMKLQMKDMGSSYRATLHQMDNYDGGSSDVFIPPIIGITAIA